MLKWRHVPNLLSLSRVPLGMLLIIFYQPQNPEYLYIAIGIILLSLVTDFADGRIARKYDVSSKLGYMLDGLGDKVFYAAFYLVLQREYPVWGTLWWILIAREISMYSLRVVASDIDLELCKLRKYSLFHAFWIRLSFFSIIVYDLLNIHYIKIDFLRYSCFFCSSIAAFGGVVGVLFQSKLMLEAQKPYTRS